MLVSVVLLVRVLANGAVWLGAAALCIVTHRVVSPCQGMICRLGLKIMPTLQPLHTGKMWRTYNWLTDNSHNNLVFKDSAVEMNVCLICRQRSVSQINPSHWLKHKRTRRKWNCIFHRSVTWMRCSCLQWSLPYNRFLFYIGPECSAASWWPRPLFSDAGKLPTVIISPVRSQNTTYLLCPLLFSSMSGTGAVFAKNVEFICLKFIKYLRTNRF